MGVFLRTLVALAIGGAAGAFAMALQPQWAAELARIATPVLAKLDLNPKVAPATAPAPYADAVLIRNTMDGGFDHFLGPYGSIRTPKAAADAFFLGSVGVTIVVDTKGNVVQAGAKGDRNEFASQAESIARRWKFIPFERNGRPVVAKIHTSVQINPPEQRRDYRQPFADVKDRHSLRIRLERTACLGTCPSYSVEITGDGKVTYRGERFVAIQGGHHATLDQRAIDDLIAHFRDADFFSLLDNYAAAITDNPNYTVSIAYDGRTKTVNDYVGLVVGMPDAVHDLEDAIDRIAGITRWTAGDSETVPSLRAEGWDFTSMKPENLSLAAGIAQYGSDGALKDLIAAGAPITTSVKIGFGPEASTALEIAAARGNAAMVSALLTAGVKWPKSVLSQAMARGAHAGITEIIGQLAIYGADARFKNEDGHTVLMNAAESGVADAIASVLFFETGSGGGGFGQPPTDKNTDVNAQDGEGKTALMMNSSSFGGDEPPLGYDRGKCVSALIGAGALVDVKDKNGDTALIANSFYVDVAAALLKGGANANAQNANGDTALMRALTPKLVEVLLQGGADPYIRNKQGKNALDVLGQRGYSKDTAAFLKAWLASHPKPAK